MLFNTHLSPQYGDMHTNTCTCMHICVKLRACNICKVQFINFLVFMHVLHACTVHAHVLKKKQPWDHGDI